MRDKGKQYKRNGKGGLFRMVTLNEDNRMVMAQHPTDMRMGVNSMCGQVRKMGLEPSNGDVYVFVGKSRTTMKLLHWELLLSAKIFFEHIKIRAGFLVWNSVLLVTFVSCCKFQFK